ncbi:MAG: glycoside hydrolase family 3 C-terminal domain-containing protein [Saprospiraceae bacterium]|nr:glycoside hydrolase family 3 C-terminal domain-containing protein [Saprospiraceae bacterium]
MQKRSILWIVFLIAIVIIPMNGTSQTWSTQVQNLLEEMTLKEKVGQMTQLSVDMICVGEPYNVVMPAAVDEEKLRKAVLEYGVGSILNTPSGDYVDVDRWQGIIGNIQEEAKKTRLRIPVLYGLDHIHGVSYIKGGTLFPQPLGLACTWNVDLAHEVGVITAYESRAAGVPWSFSPAMDISRNPEWPRFWESFGEDVLMNKEMGLAMVTGMQGNDPENKEKIAACLKHFTGYGLPLSGKDRTPAWIPERYLREYFLPQYQASIDAGALTIMVNSGEINGVPTHADKQLLTDILRGEMGFEGLLVTDWQDIHYLHDRHMIAASLKDAVRLAIEAGIDMSMTPVSYDFADLLVQLVEEKTISESRIDLSVGRILTVKEKLGLFTRSHFPKSDYAKFGSDEFESVSLQAATESLVLLKNSNDVLPINKQSKVLVIGPTSHSMSSLNGGWTTTWQGDRADSDLAQYNTIVEGIRNLVAADQVDFFADIDYQSLDGLALAKTKAAEVDYVILCIGEHSYTEDSGNLNDLNLPPHQLSLAQAMMESGKPIILIYTGGRPRIISQIEPNSTAIVGAFYPGPNGGDAIAQLIYGEMCPSGKLAFTYPQYANSLTTYDHKHTEDRDVMISGQSYNPQYAFGYGLSYTSFIYSNLEIHDRVYQKDGTIEASVTVRNTGQRIGKEVVQVYISDLLASITPPVRRLRAFEKIQLAPGEAKNVTFAIPIRDLAFVGIDNQWTVESGEFRLQIGTETAVLKVVD